MGDRSRESGAAAAGLARAAAAADAEREAAPSYDAVVIGAGPAGLSAGLNLVRARRRVLVIDANRPRHSATLLSHGFLTRDATPPGELRRLAREEYLGYSEAEHHLGQVQTVAALETRAAPPPDEPYHSTGGSALFEVRASGLNGRPGRVVQTRAVLIATGLRETLPAIEGIRSFYGMGLFSCVQCDGYEYADRPIALIGETRDLAWRALLIAQWSRRLTVFTNGADAVNEGQAARLAEAGVALEPRPIEAVEGGREGPSGIRVAGGEVLPISGGFVRPRWDPELGFAASLGLEVDGWGLLVTDPNGRTGHPGVYAAGDVTSPGPQQLIVAAGAGARAAATINRDLIGVPTAQRR